MMCGQRISHTRLKSMNEYLRNAWGVEYQRAIDQIMDVTPAINNPKPHQPHKVRLSAKSKKESTVKGKLKVQAPSAKAMAQTVPVHSF
jgi:hypothetical protein